MYAYLYIYLSLACFCFFILLFFPLRQNMYATLLCCVFLCVVVVNFFQLLFSFVAFRSLYIFKWLYFTRSSPSIALLHRYGLIPSNNCFNFICAMHTQTYTQTFTHVYCVATRVPSGTNEQTNKQINKRTNETNTTECSLMPEIFHFEARPQRSQKRDR